MRLSILAGSSIGGPNGVNFGQATSFPVLSTMWRMLTTACHGDEEEVV